METIKSIKSTKLKKVMFFVLVMIMSFTHAQKVNVNSMESLIDFEGNWNVDNYELKDEKWELIGATSSKITLEHDGKFISEKVKYLTKYGEINMITNIGYDNRLKKFKLCAMDKEYGYMDVYFGEWINEELVFTNLESDIPVKLEDGKTLSFRLTYSAINNRSFTHLVEGTYDNGKTWFSFSKSICTRAKD